MRSLAMARGEMRPSFAYPPQIASAQSIRGPTRAAPIRQPHGPAPAVADPYLHGPDQAHTALEKDPYSDDYVDPIAEPIMTGYADRSFAIAEGSSEAAGSSDEEIATPRSEDSYATDSGPNYGRIFAGVLAVAVIVPLLVWLLIPYASAFATTTPAPHDCNIGFTKWETTWSTMKKQYCCKEKDRGCPVIVTKPASDMPSGDAAGGGANATTAKPTAPPLPACHTVGTVAPIGAGHACVFPFKYNGVKHTKCTFQDYALSWCSTKTDAGEFLLGQWGECSSGCAQEPKFEEFKCSYERQKEAAIPGFNIKKLEGTTVDECQNVCSNDVSCKALEFATDRDAGGSVDGPAFYAAGTCLLQSTAEGVMPPANRYKNIDLYIKYACQPSGGPGGSGGGGSGGGETSQNGGNGGGGNGGDSGAPGEVSTAVAGDLPGAVITPQLVGATTTLYPGTTSSCPYDCEMDYNDWPMQWVKGWAGAKKLYCCKTANRGCPDQLPQQTDIPQDTVEGERDMGPYDCHAAYQSCYECVIRHWSTIKIEWCCTEKGIGCKPMRKLRALS